MSARDDTANAPGAAGKEAERGAGSILALAVLAATVLLTTFVVLVLGLLTVGRSVASAADAAALAAADTASGAIAGYPCEAAQAVASLNGTAVTRCTVTGLIASVSVGRRVQGIDIVASARAGPPP
jgi:secretion/DNA translocation related TadE-like protein